jgi:serine phosphatase RsbU (regulator of sigma subunit)
VEHTHGEPDDRELVNEARTFAVRRAIESRHADLADEVALIISELVTNAMLHGGGCTGYDVIPLDDRLRVEVHDASGVPPVFGLASEDALTGRGVRVVAFLANRWGVESTPPGKVVWAEVTRLPKGADRSLSEDDLLDMWGEQWETREGEVRYHLELGDVPTDLLLAAKAHVDNLAREFALATGGAESGLTAEVPPHLTALLDAVERFSEPRQAIKRQALEAARANAPTARLALDVPASVLDAAPDYLAALDEIDAYSRAARLLTLETPPQHRVFRQWYVGELVTQLRAITAGEMPPPPQPFEQRLLAELDLLSAAQRASERAARLYSVSAALASADSPDEVAAAVLNEGAAALRAAGGGLLLATDADLLTLPGSVGYDEAVVARLRSESRDAELPAAYTLRTGEPVWLESHAERDRRFPDLVGLEATTVSLCAVPLIVQGRVLGALRFSFQEARLFDEEEQRFVLALAALAAQALDRSQLQEARVDVSRRLQRSLLPPDLPVIPGLEVAAIYHPFGDGVEVGGDFYDVWQIAPDRWAMAIGDAAGTGPEAASLTAVVRYTLRALTLAKTDGVDLVHDLNTAIVNTATGSDGRFCTAIFGTITAGDTVDLHLLGGGHPPVFVRRADGTIESLVVGGSLLGVFEKVEVGELRVRLAPGETAVLLTDGVLEARHEDVQFEAAGVRSVLATCGPGATATVEALESAVLEHVAGDLTDDMAAIALHVPA